MLSVDDMKTSLPWREPLNGTAEPGHDLLEIDIFDVRKSVRAKNRCNASRLKTARSNEPSWRPWCALITSIRLIPPTSCDMQSRGGLLLGVCGFSLTLEKRCACWGGQSGIAYETTDLLPNPLGHKLPLITEWT